MHGIKMFSPVAQGGYTKIFGPVYTVSLFIVGFTNQLETFNA